MAAPDVGTRLRVRGVRHSLGGRRVLTAVDLDVAPGECLVVLGPSGSGKTTLLRLIAGLEAPDAGEILLGDAVVSGPDTLVAPHERSLGFVFQTPALWPHMTVAQNVAFGLERAAVAAGRVSDLLAAMEIDDLARRYPDQISGGEARRVALARALAPEPQLLLLDEPLTNLDRALKTRLLELMGRLVVHHATALHVTHDEDEAAALGDRVVRLTEGKIRPVS